MWFCVGPFCPEKILLIHFPANKRLHCMMEHVYVIKLWSISGIDVKVCPQYNPNHRVNNPLEITEWCPCYPCKGSGIGNSINARISNVNTGNNADAKNDATPGISTEREVTGCRKGRENGKYIGMPWQSLEDISLRAVNSLLLLPQSFGSLSH